MHAAAPNEPVPIPSGGNPPTLIVAPDAAAVPNPSALSRVGEFLQALSAGRVVSDAEVRQHAVDCTHLHEVAYERYQASQLPQDREESCLWLHARDEALRTLRDRGHTFVDMGR